MTQHGLHQTAFWVSELKFGIQNMELMVQKPGLAQETVSLLLLGGGYTLSRLAARLPPHSFVITSTQRKKIEEFRAYGYSSEEVHLSRPEHLAALFQKYPGITTLIDSVPPLRGEQPYLGVSLLLEALPPSLKRIFYLSTTGVYGGTGGAWVDEESPLNPFYESSMHRVQVEQLYQRECQAAVTSFRLSGIYGPGQGVGLSMRAGTYRLVIDDERYTNRVHVDDIIGILQSALRKEEPLPKALNVSDDQPALATEVVKFYQERFSLPAPILISKSEAELAGGRLTLNQRVKNALVKRCLRYDFLYPSYREGAGTEFLPLP